jgi:hypothetical protein
MRSAKFGAVGVLLVFALAVPMTTAQRVKVKEDQRYLLLATKRTGTMEKELNEVADKGFRVLVGSPTSGAEMAVFMERVATPPKTYKYKLLATTRTGTMNKELNEAAADGWRLLPRTMISKEGAGPFAGLEIIVLMERAPDTEMKYEYKLLATTLTGTLQKEVTESIAAGFTLAGMVSRDEHMVIMERESRR